MSTVELLSNCDELPVMVIASAEDAVPLAETLCNAGLSIIEVTLRTAAALDAIKEIARRVPRVTLGAGTVRTAEQLRNAQLAGAHFAVSSGASDILLDMAPDVGLPFIPGAATPSEILRLRECGYDFQKFFPAEVNRGVAFLQTIRSTMPDVQFMPTGGISQDNATAYLALDNLLCVGGSWMVPSSLLSQRNFSAIGELWVDAVRLTCQKREDSR